jgi:LacI family transcriptional regulator
MAAVARRAGVSVATVSRVLSPSRHKVSRQTQERVRAAAQELDYAPSPLAQALARGSSRIVGVLVGDNDDPHFAGIIRGAEAVANREGYLIIVGNTGRRVERELSYLRLLGAYRADGLIFIGGGVEDDPQQAALERAVEAFRQGGGVVALTTQHDLPVPRVSVDSEAAAALAVRHLLDLGHRRIGFVAGPERVRVSRVRAAGVHRALAEAGLRLDPRLVAEGDLTQAGGAAAAGRLLDPPPAQRPTALFAANDLMAVGALAAARARGIAVPADLSVVGLGDIPLAGSVAPPLTTVHFPLRDIGAAAMELVLAGLRGEAPPERRLPAHLVRRESTAPPAPAATTPPAGPTGPGRRTHRG